MKKIILHIPHSSDYIPFYDGYLVDETKLKEERLLLTDWFTDDLFNHKDAIAVVADFSRLFCDVERFADDSLEIMSKVGMGVLYETRDDGTPLRKTTPELRFRIINDYYKRHHQKFTNEVDKQLEQNGRAIIIDCHSFPDKPMKRDLNQRSGRPDINIGTDPYHTPSRLVEIVQSFCSDNNFSLGINWPYEGTIVPAEYYRTNPDVFSILIEINRRLYLMGGTTNRHPDYEIVKKTISELLGQIRNEIYSPS